MTTKNNPVDKNARSIFSSVAPAGGATARTRTYVSKLGLKIALPVAFLMFMPLFVHIFLHEYETEGLSEVYEILAFPYFWIGLALAFIAMMAILSKIVIWPLKRFEMHLMDIEEGFEAGPLEFKQNDEIGYLADRFNKLHKMVSEEIESRDADLAAIHNFTTVASGLFDVPALMDSFFKTLATFVEYDLGAYVIYDKKQTGGRIYSAYGRHTDAETKRFSARFFSRAGAELPDIREPGGHELQVCPVVGKNAGEGPTAGEPDREGAGHYIDMPVTYKGRPIGLLALFSYTNAELDSLAGCKVFKSLYQHANTVMERLLTHVEAEEHRFTDILSSMTDGVYIIDKNGRMTSINKKGMELVSAQCNYAGDCMKTGVEPSMGNCPHDYESTCGFSRLLNRVRSAAHEFDGKFFSEELKTKDGLTLQVSVVNLTTVDGRKEGYVITAKDITDERLIQKRIMLSSKLAALGEMAAGIAHEVNNPLQVMMANIELLESCAVQKDPRESRRIDHIKDGIFRIKTIVRDLLIFAREQTTEVEDLDINVFVEKAVDIMRHQLKQANIEVVLDFAGKPLPVRCNKNLLQQVIINLMQNAKDAIEESQKGGRVVIRTIAQPAGAVIEVSDDGPGIPEKVIDRIFDPFFTTKDVGKGTGLGLSVSRRIVEGMGGVISVASSPLKGTTFTINLVSSAPMRPSAKGLPDNAPEPDYSCLSDKSVIIIDDEEGVVRAVRDAIAGMVGSLDHAVDGGMAIDKMMDNDYDIILLDIKMPGVSGMEVFRHLTEAKPYLAQRVIFVTGDTETELTLQFIKLTGCRYFAKPFSMKELLRTMSEFELEMEAN